MLGTGEVVRSVLVFFGFERKMGRKEEGGRGMLPVMPDCIFCVDEV